MGHMCSLVLQYLFALDFYNVTVWHGSSTDYGPGDVLTSMWDLEMHFLP